MPTRGLTSFVVLVVVLGGCTSGSAPGAQGVLDQADKATKAQVDLALHDVARAEAEYLATNGTYTTDGSALGVNPSSGVVLNIVSADAGGFCAEAGHSDLDGTWHISAGSPSVVDGPC